LVHSTALARTSGKRVKTFGKGYFACWLVSLSLFVLPLSAPSRLQPGRAERKANDKQIMGAAILRISKLRAKWQIKITEALELKKNRTLGSWTKKYVMIILPLITVIREGLEAIVFVGGVSLSAPASAYPLPVVVGMVAGIAVSWGIYRGGNSLRIQWFLIASTMLLYLVAAGLGSRAVWKFEMYEVGTLVCVTDRMLK